MTGLPTGPNGIGWIGDGTTPIDVGIEVPPMLNDMGTPSTV